jgi:hypothetical protein
MPIPPLTIRVLAQSNGPQHRGNGCGSTAWQEQAMRESSCCGPQKGSRFALNLSTAQLSAPLIVRYSVLGRISDKLIKRFTDSRIA